MVPSILRKFLYTCHTHTVYATRWGADPKMAAVEIVVAATQIHKHNLSITSAANFHSFLISISSSSCLSFVVIFRISRRISTKSLFKIELSSIFPLSTSSTVLWLAPAPCDVGTLIQSSLRKVQRPFSTHARKSSSVSRRFGRREWHARSCIWISPSFCLWIKLCLLFSTFDALDIQSIRAKRQLIPILTWNEQPKKNKNDLRQEKDSCTVYLFPKWTLDFKTLRNELGHLKILCGKRRKCW